VRIFASIAKAKANIYSNSGVLAVSP